MADQPTKPAGSPEDKPTPESVETPVSETPAPDAEQTSVAETPPPADRRAWLRARAPLAAAAAALVLISGLGGFAIGHATGDDDGRSDRLRPAGFSGQGPRGGEHPPSFRDGERGQAPQQDSGDDS
jgi:hypothetical protein